MYHIILTELFLGNDDMFVREDLLATKYSVDMQLAATFVNYKKDSIENNNNNKYEGDSEENLERRKYKVEL